MRPKCEECGQRFDKPRSEVREIRAATYRTLTCPACNQHKIAANQVILERDQRKQRSHTIGVEYWLDRALLVSPLPGRRTPTRRSGSIYREITSAIVILWVSDHLQA